MTQLPRQFTNPHLRVRMSIASYFPLELEASVCHSIPAAPAMVLSPKRAWVTICPFSSIHPHNPFFFTAANLREGVNVLLGSTPSYCGCMAHLLFSSANPHLPFLSRAALSSACRLIANSRSANSVNSFFVLLRFFSVRV